MNIQYCCKYIRFAKMLIAICSCRLETHNRLKSDEFKKCGCLHQKLKRPE